LRDLLVEHIRESAPEAEIIVGLDSRGFLFNLLIATGGSLFAASELVRKVGGIVVESLVVMELVGLEGRQKLDGKVHSLIKY